MALRGTFTADGVARIQVPQEPARGTPWTLYVWGTWGGGSVAVTASIGAASYALPTPIAISADGFKILPLMSGNWVLTLTGATNPNLTWQFV